MYFCQKKKLIVFICQYFAFALVFRSFVEITKGNIPM